MDVKGLYKTNYETSQNLLGCACTKYEWAAEKIFDLTTYDSELDELFVKDILEVCKVILDRTNFEYILNRENYIKHILVCQILNKFHWIQWGTSIRGAWFEQVELYENIPDVKFRDIMDEYSWWEYDSLSETYVEHTIDKVPFTKENLQALIEFMEE